MKDENCEFLLPYCSSIKAVMMLIVVLSHSCAMWSINGWFATPAESCLLLGCLSDWLGTFDVPVFVFMSGYLYAYLKLETNRYDSMAKVIVKKIKRLLLPYVVVCVFWAIPFWLLFFEKSEIVSKYVLGESPSQLWFLLMLFWLFVIFETICLTASEKIKRGSASLWIVVFCFYIISFLMSALPHGSILQIQAAFKYAPFFYAGFTLRRSGVMPKYRFPYLLLLMAASFVLLALSGSLSNYGKLPAYFDAAAIWFLARAVGISMVLQVVLLAINIDKPVDSAMLSSFWSRLKDNSMGIYLLHQQLAWCILSVMNNGLISPIVIASVAFVFSLIVSLVISAVLRKWPIARFALGG